MESTFKAQIVVTSPNHSNPIYATEEDRDKEGLTLFEMKKLIENGELVIDKLIPNFGTDVFPTVFLKVKDDPPK